MELEQLAAVACILLLCWYLMKSLSRMPSSPGTRHPPCLSALPIVGSLPFLKTDPKELAHQLMEKSESLGSVFAMYFGSTYVVVLNGTDSIREALIKKSSHFAGRSPFYVERHYLNPNLKGVIYALYDDTFRRKHQLYLSILKQFGFGLSQMETKISAGVEQFIMKAKTTNGRSFDPAADVEQSVFSIIASIVFGDRYPYGHPTLTEVNDLVHNWVLSFVLQIDFFPFLRFVPPYRGLKNWAVANHQKLLTTLDKMLSDLLTADKLGANDGDCFIRQFIESTKHPETVKHATFAADRHYVKQAPSGVDFDREELLYTLRDLLAGGSDTSVTTLRWFLIEMANHREEQKRMQEEVDTVVGWDRLPSLADEKCMPYSQAVLLETMRRHTLVPTSVFHSATCDTAVGDLFVPAGTTVLVNLYSAHMDPTEWGDPNVFRPERFIDESGAVYRKDRVIPFSLGKRSCLGETLARQELFLFMTGIVQNFDIRPPDEVQQIPVVGKTAITYEPLPFEVQLIPRVR